MEQRRYKTAASVIRTKKTQTSQIGTPLSPTAKKVLLCGSGELGKELVIELQRFGVEVIACDKYKNAPAMQVAHRCHVFDMTDGSALRTVIETEQPDLIVPEIEALATQALVNLEQEGFTVIPTAHAAHMTMNRKYIRQLAAQELKIKTSDYQFADSYETFLQAVTTVGIPCIVKPVMSSSGKGQSTIKTETDIETAWHYACNSGRTKTTEVIVESFVPFDYEITLLTVRHKDGTSFCEPIGHTQKDGDYQTSWQPHAMNPNILKIAQNMAQTVTDKLGGYGLFGVEFFIKDTEVYFSELSPRPHDTGMVTLISQELSEFALHARAILGLPIPEIIAFGPSASQALLVEANSNQITFNNIDAALSKPGTQLRLFGKPEVHGKRRMGVALARGATVQEALEKVNKVIATITVE